MDHFSILLVDDTPDIRELTESDFRTRPDIRVRTSASRAEAEELIRKEFYHLALIDAQLQGGQADLSGFLVLEALKELRPSCERIILSYMGRDAFRNAEPIALQMNPIAGPAQGLVLKNDAFNNSRKLIEKRAEKWLKNPLEVEGADRIADRLRDRFRGRTHDNLRVEVTADEIDFLVSKVFGQGEPWNIGAEGLGIRRIVLDLIPRQGFSAAAVAKARCYSVQGVPGNKCVLKFASREYIQQEFVRYSQYVRHRLINHHRVELLGCEFADNFGVLCYNFASDTSLSDCFLRRNRAFFGAFDDLFSPGKKGWYSERDRKRLGEHFHATYQLDIVSTQGQIREEIRDLRDRFNASLIGPDDVLPKRVFGEALPACVVHGDLHCDNVLVSPDGKPMLIDYYSVDTGPLAVDFAVMEASVRLLDLQIAGTDGKFVENPRSDEEVIPQVLSMGPAEERIWTDVWGSPPAPRDPGDPTWETASVHIGRKARENFEELTEEQYAATCLLWGMRLFKIPTLAPRIRVRLLIWMSCLTKVLKRL